jgi:hypothetical protein
MLWYIVFEVPLRPLKTENIFFIFAHFVVQNVVQKAQKESLHFLKF